MPSPSRIFKGLTLVELQAIKASALERVTNGEFTSMSGGGKSHSKKYAMDPQDILTEVNFEIGILDGTRPGTNVYQDFTGQNNGTGLPLYIP